MVASLSLEPLQLTLKGGDFSPICLLVAFVPPHDFQCCVFVLLICLLVSLEITSNPVFSFLWFI